MPNEDEELPGYHAAADRPSCSNAWYTVESVDKLIKFHETLLTLYQILQRGPFCQVPFRCIYHCHSSKSTGKETGKTHLCVLEREGLSSEAWYSWSSSSSFGILSMDFRYSPQESKMKSKVAEKHISSRTFPTLYHTFLAAYL